MAWLKPLVPRLAEREQLLTRLIQENGITYNVYSENELIALMDNGFAAMIFEGSEWNMIADAMKQRVRCALNKMAADSMAQETTLKWPLPVSLVLGNPCFPAPVPPDCASRRNWIHLYAADLARARLTVLGGSYPIDSKPRQASAIVWKTESSRAAFCQSH